MNIESICSPYADLAALTDVLNNSEPAFKRGVFDFCAAFNLKAAAVRDGRTANDVNLMTPNGWVAGRLMYNSEYIVGEREYFFKYVSRKIKKLRGDGRADRNARAATKIRDLIKVLRNKKEMITDANAFEHERRAVHYAIHRVVDIVHGNKKPDLHISHDLAASVARAALDGVPLPEVMRAEMQAVYAQFCEKKAVYEEATSSLEMFKRGCTLVGIINDSYFVGKAKFVMPPNRNDYEIELQGEVKRYKSLVDAGLATDAAIIRTYMQGKPGYESSNELGLPRTDHYYDEIEVATGYAGDTMLWALIPERT